MKTALTLVAGLLLAAPAFAGTIDDLQKAKEALQTARTNLREVPPELEGHRRDALENVNKALHHVNEALAIAHKNDRKDDKKADRLEKKSDKLDKKVDELRDKD